MSIASLSNLGLVYKPFPLFHRRNDSSELDVFEAAGYFSGYIEAAGGGFNGGNFTQKISKEESKRWRGGTRMSLDMTIETIVSEQSFNGGEKRVKGKELKNPSSPGGRLASFLNSLFNQAVSKKKKTTKSSAESLKDGEERSGSGRRKRRSSLIHIPGSNTTCSKSMDSSSISDFRSPFLFVQTPTKNFKEFKQNMTPLKHRAKPGISEDKRKKDSSAIMEETLKLRKGFPEKQKKNNGVSGKDLTAEAKTMFKREAVDEDGGDSDSSSDLFELQITNLNHRSSNDLPVYESTKLETI